jgi:YD repeat-containing protein
VLDLKQNKVGTTTVSSYDYTVNAIGQRTNVSQDGTAFQAIRAIGWGYDSLGQVTSADHSTQNAFDRAYQYDAIGNRIEARDGVTAVTGTPNYTSNALNQYTAVPSVASVPSYDDDGNATSYPLPADPGNLSTLAGTPKTASSPPRSAQAPPPTSTTPNPAASPKRPAPPRSSSTTAGTASRNGARIFSPPL